MTTVIIVIHLMVVLAMIGLVLLQRSEGGALGIGGGSGGFMTGRGAGNVLTRSTAILAVVFFVTSLSLALLSRLETRPSDILEAIPGRATTPAEAPAAPVPAAPPTSAEDLLRQLGGSSEGGGASAPNGSTPAAPGANNAAPDANNAAPDANNAAPAAPAQPPAASTEAPGPQTPPAGGGGAQ